MTDLVQKTGTFYLYQHLSIWLNDLLLFVYFVTISKVYVLKYQSEFETQIKINTIHHSARLKQTKNQNKAQRTKQTDKNYTQKF